MVFYLIYWISLYIFLSVECPDTVPATGLNGSLPTCTDDTQCSRAGDKCCTVTTGGSGKVCIKAGNLFIQAKHLRWSRGKISGIRTPLLWKIETHIVKIPPPFFYKQMYPLNPNPRSQISRLAYALFPSLLGETVPSKKKKIK